MTNKLVEGVYSGNLGDLLGKPYADYKWTGEIVEVSSNKLFRADVVIQSLRGPKNYFHRKFSPAKTSIQAAGRRVGAKQQRRVARDDFRAAQTLDDDVRPK